MRYALPIHKEKKKQKTLEVKSTERMNLTHLPRVVVVNEI